MNKAKLSDAEFEILKVIWDAGKASVSQIHKSINEQRESAITRNTVQVQIKRLIEKGRLERHKIEGNFYYSAINDENESCTEIAVDIKQRVFGGSVSKLVKCLFNNDGISDSDIKELEELINKNKSGES